MVDAPDVRNNSLPTETTKRADGTIVGVTVFDTERELPGLFEEWRALGINTVFASEELTSSGGFRALARKMCIWCG